MARIPSRTAAVLAAPVLEQVRKKLEAVHHRPVDRLETMRRPPVELHPHGPDLTQLFERVAYKKGLEAMTPAELKEEALRVEEQLTEASTGHSQDPEAAAEARWKGALIEAELSRRTLEDPTLPMEQYGELLAGLSAPQLKAEVKRLEAAAADATTGPHTNAEDAKKLEGQLAAARSEQAQRVVDDPEANVFSYLMAVPRLSDAALTAEQTEVHSAYDVTLKALAEHPEDARKLTGTLEALARKLNVLDREASRRGLEPALYTVVEGDSLSAIAMRISDEHGGTPDWQTVMADLVTLNAIENPDLISVDQQLQVPAYP